MIKRQRSSVLRTPFRIDCPQMFGRGWSWRMMRCVQVDSFDPVTDCWISSVITQMTCCLSVKSWRFPLSSVCSTAVLSVVFFDQLSDYHHDALFPSSIPPSEIIKRANAIFTKRGIKPKQHLSEPRPGAVTLMERGAHADRCQNLPADLPDDMGRFLLFNLCTPSTDHGTRFNDRG